MKYTALFTILLSVNFLCAMKKAPQTIEINVNNKLDNPINMLLIPKNNSDNNAQPYLIPNKKIGTLSLNPQIEDAELILSYRNGCWNIPIEIESKKKSYSIEIAE